MPLQLEHMPPLSRLRVHSTSCSVCTQTHEDFFHVWILPIILLCMEGVRVTTQVRAHQRAICLYCAKLYD